MILCRRCGQHNDDAAEFCLSCKAYLPWEGERIFVPAAPRSGGGSQPASGTRAPPSGPLDPAMAPSPPSAVNGEAPPGPAGQAGMTGPAPRDTLDAVQPAPPREQRPPVLPASPRPVPGPDATFCSTCGVDNDPGRVLCRSCGAALLRTAPVRLPWWRRPFRQPTAAAAGDRPGRGRRRRVRRVGTAVRSGIALSVIAALALMIFGPGRDLTRRGATSIKALFTTVYDPVTAVSAGASSAARGHPAHAAIDGIKTTAWAEGVPGLGQNQTLTVVLGQKVDLARVLITPGASDVQAKFLAQPRPREVRMSFPGGSSQTVALRDEAVFQSFPVDVRGVDRVTFELLSVYKGQTGQDTSIAEVEFFTKR